MNISLDLYNLIHTGNDGDLNFYFNSCESASSVLELGCGTGRITLVLLSPWKNIYALDINESSLKELEKKAKYLNADCEINTVLSSMSRFDLNKKFDRIIIPFNSILCLLSSQDILSCFGCISKHLKPQGELIFDYYYLPEEIGNDEDDYESELGVYTYKGNTLHVFEKTFGSKESTRFDTQYTFFFIDGPLKGHKEEIIIKQRCLYLLELEGLLTQSGLKIKDIYSDFKDEPVGEHTSQVIIKAILA
jgi:SAM-dependent methyltransferase